MLEEKSINFVNLDGRVSAEKRMKNVNRFNDRKSGVTIILLGAQAGACGLNLVGASKMIMFEPDWNPKNDAQVMGRVWRIGQTKPVQIYRLFICGSIEEVMLRRQLKKEGVGDNMVDDEEDNAKISKDELKEIFNFKNDECCLSYPAEEN